MKAMDRLQGRDNPKSLANRFRVARAKLVMDVIASSAKDGRCRILDVGGEPAYWKLFDRSALEALGVQITVVNRTTQVLSDPLFTFEAADACDMPQYADNSFDLVHSNSVIEHVGDWDRRVLFAKEIRRIAPAYYVQTPYLWFPVEPHFSSPFFHWMSEGNRARRLTKRTYGFKKRPAADFGEAMQWVQGARLLDKTQFDFLFPDARHEDEKVGPLTKSLIAIRS